MTPSTHAPEPPHLEDRFRRRINYLRVSVTDRCNLRCVYCMPPEGVALLGHDDILSYEEIVRVARVAIGLGIEKIRVTGGEPLVRRDVAAFVARIAALPGLRDLSLTTNGLLLEDNVLDLKRAGLSRVNVSLDTLDPDRFESITRRRGLGRVLAGIAAAKRAGLSPIKINVVAMRGVNDDEIVAFAKFAEEHACDVRFIEIMPANPRGWEADRFLRASEILDVLRSRYDLAAVMTDASSGPGRIFQLPSRGRVGVISPLSDHFCGSCNRLRITAAGRLRSCLFSDHETDLKPLLRGGAGDDLVASAIREAVHHKPERHTLRDAQSQEHGLAMSRVGG